MGKTYKRQQIYDYFRKPKGRKQAKINNVRKGAIPPDSWDDVQHDDQCYVVYRLLEKMIDSNISDEEIEHKLVNKFKISHPKAIEFIRQYRHRKYDINI